MNQGTPMTDSSSDDDFDATHNQQMGTFSERNLDGHNNHGNRTPLTDSDDDLNSKSNIINNSEQQHWIKINEDGAIETFSITQHDTLKDLRAMINGRGDSFRMSDCHYFSIPKDDNNDVNDEDEDEEEIGGRLLMNEDALAIKWDHCTLCPYWKSFTITIVDGMDLELNLRVAQDYTIKKLKDEVERNYSVRLQCLSYNGMELVDSTTLGDHDISRGGYTLISRISISVEDHTCGISTDLLICDFWDFEQVLMTYLDSERREFHRNASFYYQSNPVNMKENVNALQLTNRSKLIYKVERYEVCIYDSEIRNDLMANNTDLNAYKLVVYDYWTLNDVKRAYSKLTKKPFMEKEKLLSNELELEDNVPLWKLRIRDNEKLIIEREQQEALVTYVCCECNARVQLRRYDSVQCRQCFHGAVFKMRTQRVCQYSCR